MKTLVLGGTRFVGLQLVHQLSALKHDITILNRGKTQAVLPPGVKRLYADRRDPESLRQVLSGQEFDAITVVDPRTIEVAIRAGRSLTDDICVITHATLAALAICSGLLGMELIGAWWRRRRKAT